MADKVTVDSLAEALKPKQMTLEERAEHLGDVSCNDIVILSAEKIALIGDKVSPDVFTLLPQIVKDWNRLDMERPDCVDPKTKKTVHLQNQPGVDTNEVTAALIAAAQVVHEQKLKGHVILLKDVSMEDIVARMPKILAQIEGPGKGVCKT